MNKRTLSFVLAVVIIAVLGGLYVWREYYKPPIIEQEEESQPEQARPTSIVLIDKLEAEIASVVFSHVDGHSLTLASVSDEEGEMVWVMQDAPRLAIYQSMAREMVRAFLYLSAEDIVLEQVDNPADFGIGGNITATATYTDGSTHTIHVGSLTPNHERFYMMLDGDPALYLLYTYYGTRYLNTASDLIDRTLPYLLMDGAEYLLINERGSEPMEFAFRGTAEEKEEMYERFGMVTLHMVTPHPGRELYYGNIDQHLMDDFNTYFRLGEMVDLVPADYTPYGLHDPSLELRWVSMLAVDTIHLLFGDRTDDGLIYVKHADSPEVYLADYEAVKQFYGANPFLFVERFMALVDILDVETVAVNYPSDPARSYHMVINHAKAEPTEWHPEGRDIIFPTINGIEIEESPFRNMYRQMIGMTSDVDIDPFEPTGQPDFTIVYNKRDGGEPTQTAYYLYETHFYAMSRNGGPCLLVISRQATEEFFRAIEELME